ncbi:MAG TPA: cytochrome c oxidase subunit II [Bradyrhizobium sp.]|nr:cytochrome c oxidase subunit II [Bradyrhizobium sp.]
MKSFLPLLLIMVLAAGCRDGQSALTPHGVQAAEIAQLSWALFAGGAFILLVVIAATWIAVRGPAAFRQRLATQRLVVAGGIVFPAVVLTSLLFFNVALMDSSARVSADKLDTVPVAVSGEQWWWRVTYSSPAGALFASANEIRIPVGRDVVFTLSSADIIHSFWVPSLAGKVDMIPGRQTRLRVHATRPGVFRGPCAEYCGGPHALMALQVTAMPAHDFDAWLAREQGDAVEPRSDTEREGQALFLASGCGSCHAVRGTSAAGAIGPDLTHLGSRRSIGADTLPLDRDNLVRFIAEGQRVKPGNKMPEFRIFTEAQRNALAAYLLSVK